MALDTIKVLWYRPIQGNLIGRNTMPQECPQLRKHLGYLDVNVHSMYARKPKLDFERVALFSWLLSGERDTVGVGAFAPSSSRVSISTVRLDLL